MKPINDTHLCGSYRDQNILYGKREMQIARLRGDIYR